MTRIDRRGFLAGGPPRCWSLRHSCQWEAASRGRRIANFEPNAFIRIGEDGKITLIMRDVEMGQGIWTGASMLMAEELDVGLDQVTPDFAPPNDKLYANPLLGLQATGGSTSIRADWQSLRKAAAIARAALVQAAAKQWGVEPAACTVARGNGHSHGFRADGHLRIVGGARRDPAAADGCAAEGSQGLDS